MNGQSLKNANPAETKTYRVMNYPLLIGTFVCAVVLGLLAYGLHAYQVRGIGEAFRDRADVLISEAEALDLEAEDLAAEADTLAAQEEMAAAAKEKFEVSQTKRIESQDKWHNAAECLGRYLQLKPDAPDDAEEVEERAEVQALLAEIYDKIGAKKQAIDYYSLAIDGAGDKKQEIWRRYTVLLNETGKYGLAEREAAKFIVNWPEDPAGYREFAFARFSQLKKTRVPERFGEIPEEFKALLVGGAAESARAVPWLDAPSDREASDAKWLDTLNSLYDVTAVVMLEDALGRNSGEIALSVGLAELYRDEALLPRLQMEEHLRRGCGAPQVDNAVADQMEEGEGIAESDQAITAGQANDAYASLLARLARCTENAEEPLSEELRESVLGDEPGGLQEIVLRVYRDDAVVPELQQQELLRAVRAALADDVMDQMVVACSEDATAYYCRYWYRVEFGLPGASGDLDMLLELAPGNLLGLLLAANRAFYNGDLAKARSLYQRVTVIVPDNVLAQSLIGQIMVSQGESVEDVCRHFEGAREHCGEDNIPLIAGLVQSLITLECVWKVEGRPDARAALEELNSAIAALDVGVPTRERNGYEAVRDELWARYYLIRGEYAKAEPLLKNVIFLVRDLGTEPVEGITPEDGYDEYTDKWVERLESLLALASEGGPPAVAKLPGEGLSEDEMQEVRVIAQRCEQAIREGDLATAEQCEVGLRDVEGGDGAVWRFYRGYRLLVSATAADDPQLAEVEVIRKYLVKNYPAWPNTYLLGGMLFERRQEPTLAIDAYNDAIIRGLNNIQLVERVVTLLYRLERYEEVDQILTQLQDRLATSQTLSGVRIARAMENRLLEEAVTAAKQATTARPKDPFAHIWLGHVLRLSDRSDEAVKAFEQAVKVAPHDPRAITALFDFYAKSDRNAEATQLLQRLAAVADTPAGSALVLAQGYVQMGDREQAKKHYLDAIRLAPTEVLFKQRYAVFLAAEDPNEAERVLREALRQSPDDRGVRRTLATLLAARGGEREWEEIAQLLEQTGDDESVTVVDKRLQAMLLTSRGGKTNLEKAQALLEELVSEPGAVTDEDRLLLASIYDGHGDFEAARGQYQELVAKAKPAPAHLMVFIDFLIRTDKADEAATWLAKLEEVLDGGGQMAVLVLQARILQAQGRADEVPSVVETFAAPEFDRLEEDEQKAGFAKAVGDAYMSVDCLEQAEIWYRKLDELDPRQFAPLASCLAQQGKVDETIALCGEKLEDGEAAIPAIVLASLVGSKDIPSEPFDRLEAVFSVAMEESPENLEVLMAVANVQVVRDEMDEAIRLYRRVLETQPKSVVVLNNLATLLAETPKTRGEALDYIDQALEIAGPQNALLDTKAMILVQDGKPGEAIPLLETACGHYDPDPRYPFHLAVAYHRVGDDAKAVVAFERAIDSGLEEEILTGSDEQMLQELEDSFQVSVKHDNET